MGSISGYLTKGLQELGIKAICIDARKTAAILSVTISKNLEDLKKVFEKERSRVNV